MACAQTRSRWRGTVKSTPIIRMTQYSHGSGCGCKLSSQDLDSILSTSLCLPDSDRLIVGNHQKDDAAVYDLGNGDCLISTTDFFTPVVDDPFTFGRIAATNAISDVYAMGGRPVLAVALLGWPIDTLPAEHARRVVEGGRKVCAEAGIPLAGGHSIDAPEPFFGLAVNGLVRREHVKTNSAARVGDLLFLTKSLGIGLLATAEKHGTLREADRGLAATEMMRLNQVGMHLGAMPAVHAITDVTGFGLLGHLLEMCDGAGLAAEVDYRHLPFLTDLSFYVASGALARGLKDNWKGYGHRVTPLEEPVRSILADPQTSGGLLIAVAPDDAPAIQAVLRQHGLSRHIQPIGRFVPRSQEPTLTIIGHEHVERVHLRFGLDAPILNLKNREATMGDEGDEALAGMRMECTPPQPARGTPGEMWKMMKVFFRDLWKFRSEVRKQSIWIDRFARKRGLTVNPHWMFNANLKLWLVESEQSFGRRYCPCFEPSDDAELNRRMICPCDFIDSDIATKGTCHCTLFGRGDLDDRGFKEAEARLMREYRVVLPMKNGVLDTSAIPTDPARGLKVPDAYHLAKRALMLHGLPLRVSVERDFEADNLERWASAKGMHTRREETPGGYLVTLQGRE